VSFSEFKSKDPFHPQISDCAGDATANGASACGSNNSHTASVAPKPVSTPKPSSGTAPSSSLFTGGSKPATAKVTQATISVNGVASTVSVGRPFPAAAPLFTLVSLTRNAATIGIAGGSYESGAATISVKKGQTLTLMNTADGTRYVLRFVSAA
jgi:hypothetical protein